MKKPSEKKSIDIDKRYKTCSCGARLNKEIINFILKPYCVICGKSI